MELGTDYDPDTYQGGTRSGPFDLEPGSEIVAVEWPHPGRVIVTVTVPNR